MKLRNKVHHLLKEQECIKTFTLLSYFSSPDFFFLTRAFKKITSSQLATERRTNYPPLCYCCAWVEVYPWGVVYPQLATKFCKL